MKKVIFSFLLTLTFISAFAQKKSKTDDLVTISTNFGDFVLILSDKTPKHKENFLKLAREGFYNGTTFHRIIDEFMIQGGDPLSKDSATADQAGRGGPGYTIPAEFDTTLTHKQGAVAAARLGDQMNPKKESSGSQFYIVEGKSGAHFLDKNYTVFGQVIKGIDVVEKIAVQPKNYADKPLQDIKMTVKVEKQKKKAIEKKYQGDFYE